MSLPLRAEINLSNILQNAKNAKNLLNAGVKFCAVVKSNAYGHGIIEVSKALYSVADYFAVSIDEEVYSLRLAGIDKPILLLTPAYKTNVEKLLKFKTTFSVSSSEELKLILKTAKKHKTIAYIHIAVNSGMNRLGVSTQKEITELLSVIDKNKKLIKITGVFSHFASPKNKTFTNNQFKTFLNLAKIIKEYEKNVILHISSSGGLLISKKYQLNMVRVGILLYGYKPFESNKIAVAPALKIYAPYIKTSRNLLNKHALYGNGLCKRDTLTLVRLGYADGFLRGYTFEKNLCMDLSYTKNAKVYNFNGVKYIKILDNAEILAKKYKTIAYEVLLSSTRRCERIYLNYANNKWKI